MLRETFTSQDGEVSSWIERYPNGWRDYIRLLGSRDWLRLIDLTRQTPRRRFAPTEYDAGIRLGAIVYWTSSDLPSTPQVPTPLTGFVADILEIPDDNVSEGLPQLLGRRLDDFCALVDVWKAWDITTRLVNLRSILHTVLEFSKLEAANPQDHELPKTVVDIAIRVDIRHICAHINGVVRDPGAYQDLLNARDDDAQQLLDLLQDLLDYPHLDSAIRPVLWKALLKLSKNYGLHPRILWIPDLQLTDQVGGGGFADIWRSDFHNETVCVKVMRVFNAVDIETLSKAFRNEAIIWRQLSHPNLLPFLGAFYQEMNTQRRLCLVSPWMISGDIHNYLKSNPAGLNRLTLVLDVAIGLEHLHSLNLVHGDLKAMNVLVTRSGRAVLADFGLSSVVMHSRIAALSSTYHSGGTTRWQAPELLQGDRRSFASDMYAFGCVFYEITTGNVPFFEVAEAAVLWHIYRGNVPQRLPEISDDVWALMAECWATEPVNRPTAKDVIARLSAPPINAVATDAASDWEPEYPSKFRASLPDHALSHFMPRE
ncbi:kinase-like domain-containing protein [Mycena pura]|uniref:Kinase-like domain-containing protein n=1 Tax=Mycena pura TaxID=153505 RepID=A0AAD6VW27_9AGAR|nr:kinase-like domain-containing protein [Mycena pura]